MPDASGFPTPDELINGTGPTERVPAPAVPDLPPAVSLPSGERVPVVAVSEQQRKAIELILSGMPYVLVACRETVDGRRAKPGETATGCDFLTTLDGNREVLRNAKEHLPGVIDLLYGRSGIV
jgi:hypothetical protein